jgi:hypothetical protein
MKWHFFARNYCLQVIVSLSEEGFHEPVKTLNLTKFIKIAAYIQPESDLHSGRK